MKVDFIESWGSDLSVVNAARVSFDKHSDELLPKDEKLIHYLAKHKHTSCFEHMGATLKLKVPIFIARQIQRHRTFSYNEISRRYVDSPPEFFWPDKWRKRAENVKQGSSDEEVVRLQTATFPLRYPSGVEGPWTDTGTLVKTLVDRALCVYTELLDAGVAPEQARMILPQATYTEFYMSGENCPA